MIKLIKENYKLYLFSLVIIILMFSCYIFFNNGIILQPGDPFELNYKLWLGGINQIRLGEMGQFNWSLGFGANNFSYVFYFLTSPFFLISLLFPSHWIPQLILVFSIIQLWLGFVFTHIWLRKITKNNISAIIGAFMIGMGAYGIFYLQTEQLLKCLFLYPLVFYFTEAFLKDRKFVGLTITIAIIGITQFYLLYQLIPFACIYALVRYLSINKSHLNIKDTLLCALKYVGFLFLGIGISAFILLPCAYLILSMPRFTTMQVGLLDHLDRYQLYEVFTSLFTPVFQKLDANAFIAANQHDFFGWSGSTPIYSLIITPCTLILIFFVKDKFIRNITFSLYAVLFIFVFFQSFSILFQASLDTRWFFMFNFTNAYTVSYLTDKIIDKEFTNKQITLAFFVPILLIISFLAITYFFSLNSLSMFIKLLLSSCIMILFILIYYFIIYKRFNYKYLVLALSFEALYCGFIFYYFNEPINHRHFESNEMNNDLASYFHYLDNGFYRVMYDPNTFVEWRNEEKHIQSLTTANEPMAYAYPGFAFYESVYNTNQEEFMNRFKSTHNMPQAIGRTKIYNLLSAKYWYTFNYQNEVPYGFNLIYESPYGYHVYENENFVELGFAYNKTINSDFLLQLPYLEQDRIMQNYLATETSENTTYQITDEIELLTTLPADTIRVYEFEKPIENVNLYLEVFGLPHTIITTYLDDEIVKTYDLWQFNYIDFPVYQKINKIVIEAEDIYSNGTEVPLYIEPLDSEYTASFKELTQEKFENVQFKNDYIAADITIKNNNKTVFTSIPYDKGWSVYVDGKKIEYEKVQLGFIGFGLEPGSYHIEFRYQIPMLNLGIGISVLSLLGLSFISIYRINRKK